jgi:hypothetical protein
VDFYAFIMEEYEAPGGRYDPSSLVWSEQGVRLAVADPRNATLLYRPSQVRSSSLWHALQAQCMWHRQHIQQHQDKAGRRASSQV